MKTWVTFAVLLCCLALSTAFFFKRSSEKCVDKYSQEKCEDFVNQDTCHTKEARENCGVTCEACGEACKDWHSRCSEEDVMEDLCDNHAGAFMICARSCNLCIDQ